MRYSAALSEIAGTDVFLKLESEQITASFKLRGAYNVLATLTADERRRGVVAASAGNHGLAVAYASRVFGVQAKVYVPSNAPDVKKNGIRDYGTIVDDSAPHYDAAALLAREFADRSGAAFINPCAGETLLAGQGTIAVEIFEQHPGIQTIVLPVGGGGLLGGVGTYAKSINADVRIVGAQSDQTAALALSFKAGRIIEVPYTPTIADGLAGQVDEEGLAIAQHVLDEIVLLTEDEVASAVAWLWRCEKVRAEGSGAVAPGALLHRKHTARGPVAAIVSGANIDETRFERILATSAPH
jgi:threonine dehydratase